MKHVYALVLGALVGWQAPACAQRSAPVGWFKVGFDRPLQGRWSWCSEVETRQRTAQLAGQQLGRLGLRLHVAPGLQLTTGYVFAANDAPTAHGAALPEHRLYQEVALAETTGPLRTAHRFRAEERWLRPRPEAAYRFAPRLRYQMRLVVPLHAGNRLPVGGFYAVAADELFAGLGPREGRSFLEENRLSAGLGYRLSSLTTVEVAYLHQSQAAGLEAGQSWVRNALQLSVAVAAPAHRALVRK